MNRRENKAWLIKNKRPNTGVPTMVKELPAEENRLYGITIRSALTAR